MLDRYVSPDGVTITRMTEGDGATCYMSGFVNATMSTMMASGPPRGKQVNCPAKADWVRH